VRNVCAAGGREKRTYHFPEDADKGKLASRVVFVDDYLSVLINAT